MENIVSWYVWWQKTKKSKGKEDRIIEERQTKEFTDHKTIKSFEEGKIDEGYETGHGYYLEIP